MTDLSHLPYRPCVGIALFNAKGQVFVGERLDSPGGWQMPQGGVDDGETIEAAAFRELLEETGTDKADLLEISPEKLAYDLPADLQKRLWQGRYRGQEQSWVALRFTGQDSDINITAFPPIEFGAWQWVDLDRIESLIVPFKRDIYRHVAERFKKYAKPL